VKRHTDIPPIIKHVHMDNTCAIDSESIEDHSYEEDQRLKDAMATQSTAYLTEHYRDYRFGIDFGKKPSNHSIVVRFGKGWRWADWRVT